LFVEARATRSTRHGRDADQQQDSQRDHVRHLDDSLVHLPPLLDPFITKAPPADVCRVRTMAREKPKPRAAELSEGDSTETNSPRAARLFDSAR
jgi:hypothetical protein